jgi:hypothetical protein
MRHLTEEELIEHYYGKSDSRIAHHLAKCGECAVAYTALAGDLTSLKAAEPPPRDSLYGEKVWRALSKSLPPHAVRRRSWLRLSAWQAIGYATACAVLLLSAFLAGRQWELRKPHVGAKNDALARQQVVLVDIGDHLDRSEGLLVELKHADPTNGDIIFPLQEEARGLLASNQACRDSLTQIGDPVLAVFLDRLSLVLDELASEPGGSNGANIKRLQDQINSDDLLFEVRVLRSRVPERKTGGAAQSHGGTI